MNFLSLSQFCLAAVALVALSASAFAQETETPRITAIHAQLYYERTASFSEDIIAEGQEFGLWNTIIGEGDARDASNFTLVTIEIHGRHLPINAYRVEMSAVDEDGRVLARRTTSVSIYDESTTFFAPLFLYNTGCGPITVRARLIGQGAGGEPAARTIPFYCGE